MVAESYSAHRPALPADARTGALMPTDQKRARSRRRIRSFLVSAVTLTVLAVAPVLAVVPVQASISAQAGVGEIHKNVTGASTTATTDTVHVSVTPTQSPSLLPGEDLVLSVIVENHTDETVPVGTVEIYLAQLALTTRAALSSWLRPTANAMSGDQLVSVPMTLPVPPGTSATIPVTVPADSIGLTDRNAWGARGIAARIVTGDFVRAEGRGTFIWAQEGEVTPVSVASILPITTPESATGLIPAQLLESYTSPAGLLSVQLDAALAAPTATIALDPQIIASIRVLGTQAPASAAAWLDRLASAGNDIFPLSYADADIALQAQAGAATLLTPTSFGPLIDPSRFVVPPATSVPQDTSDPAATPSALSRSTVTATSTPTPTPSVTPSPTEAPGETVIPSTKDLLNWNYTSTSIGWPVAGQVAESDLAVFAASGLTTTILASENVEQSDVFTPNTATPVTGGVGLVSDTSLSRAIRDASEATTEQEWRGHAVEAAALLAIVSAENPNSARTLVVTFDRAGSARPIRAGQTLAFLDSTAWSNAASLQAAQKAPMATTVTFHDEAIDSGRITLARSLLQREGAIANFATILADPLSVTAPARLYLLTLLDGSWASKTPAWEGQVKASLATSLDLLNSVSVTTRGPIVVVGSKVDLRINLNNALDQVVTVRTEIIPSNGRLVVGDTPETVIQPGSGQAVSVPLSAAVGNGDVVLRVTLYAPNGTRIGQSAPIDVSVRADWEGLGATIFAVLVIAFFGFGIWRNIAGRRRERLGSRPAPVAQTIPTEEDTP